MLFIPHVFTIILSEKNGNSHSNYTNTLWVEDEKNENFNFLDSSLDPLQNLFSPGIEPGTFCVLDRCDNRYTTKTR